MEFIDDRGAFLSYLYHHCHCVNAGQSPEKRRLKYAIARSMGKNWSWAMGLRDYRDANFAKYFGYSSWKNLINKVKESV